MAIPHSVAIHDLKPMREGLFTLSGSYRKPIFEELKMSQLVYFWPIWAKGTRKWQKHEGRELLKTAKTDSGPY